jgi:Fe-S cluster biosynthesis and repair protein YggX
MPSDPNPRLVMCKKLGKELPGLPKPPYKNELGKRIYDEVSKEAWDMWIRDSVKYINTYRVDLTSAEGQKFMFDQAEVYFGFKEGKLADTAFVAAQPGADADDE